MEERAATNNSGDSTIEQYVDELRNIADALQRENIRLDDAVALYRRGSAVARKAEQLLNTYAQEIEVIDMENRAR